MFLPASESAQPVPTVICGQGWKGKKGGVPGTPREQWGPYVLSSPGLRAPSQLVEPHYLILVRVRCAGEPGGPTQGVGPNRARGRDVGSQGPDCLLAIRREEESRRTWEVKIQGRRGKSPHLPSKLLGSSAGDGFPPYPRSRSEAGKAGLWFGHWQHENGPS